MINYEFIFAYKFYILLLISVVLIYFHLNPNKFKDLISAKTKISIKLAFLGIFLIILQYLKFLDESIIKVLNIIVSLIVIFCVATFLNILLKIFFIYRSKKEIQPIILNLFEIVIYAFATLVTVRVVFKMEISSIITTSAILTGALVFALQNSLTNIFTGINIQLNKHFSKGTWIHIRDRDIYGEILSIGIFFTELRTLDNVVLLIPNYYFFNNIIEKVSNIDGHKTSAIKIKFSATYETPPLKVKSLVIKLLENEQRILKQPQPSVRLFSFEESGIEYEAKFYISDFSMKEIIRDEIQTRIWYSMMRSNYSFPYPHREIIEKVPQKPYYIEQFDLLKYFDNIDFLKPLSNDDKVLLSNSAKYLVYSNGETIVKEGDSGDSFFIILEGKVGIYIDGHYIRSLEKGDFFGEMSLFSGEKRNATVITESESILLEIDKDIFEKIFKKHNELIETVSTILSNRIIENVEHKKRITKKEELIQVKKDMLYKIKQFFGL